MRSVLAKLIQPAQYLAFVNVLLGGLGLIQSLWVARGLSLAALGVVAVITGVNNTLLNFIDVRLADLAARLYYRPVTPDPRVYQASVLVLCLIGNAGLSVVLGLASIAVSAWVVPAITSAPVALGWFAAQAAATGLGNLTNTLNYLQRFSGRFVLFGTWRLGIRLAAVLVFGGVFASEYSLDRYYLGLVLGNGVAFLLTGLVTAVVWLRAEALPLGRRAVFTRAWPAYRQSGRFLFYGNMLGYAKLLHRAADVLVVGWLTDDTVTGLYKFARSLSDSLYLIFDAVNQVYQPRCLELLASGAEGAYRALARRSVLWVTAALAGVLLGELLLLRPALSWLFADKFADSEGAIIILTFPVWFVLGVHLWLWPLFVHSGRLGQFTVMSLIAGASQHLIYGLVLVVTGPAVSVAGLALGYLAHYLVLYPAAVLLARARHGAYLPRFGPR